jgi:hypothetical protein
MIYWCLYNDDGLFVYTEIIYYSPHAIVVITISLKQEAAEMANMKRLALHREVERI